MRVNVNSKETREKGLLKDIFTVNNRDFPILFSPQPYTAD